MKITDLISKLNDVIPYTYEDFNNQSFEPIIKHYLDSASYSPSPKFVHMLGIPGCGKSTFYKNNQEKFNNYVFISFDAIMEAHPQYQIDVLKLGSAKAFQHWELPARIAGYELLRRAVETHKNIFFDHSAAPKCHQELLHNLKDKFGYTTQMFYIPCSAELAIKRAKQREEITHRHTPVKLITDRIKLVEKNKAVYQKIVDEFFSVPINSAPY